MIDFGAYVGLFASALIAATVIPMGSEAVLVGLIIKEYPVGLLLLVATTGNVLGSVINWGLGWQVKRFQDKPWFPVGPKKLAKATTWYHRYGRWSLLLSWAPIIGDPITMAAGVFREPIWFFLVVVTVAKFGRYAVLAATTFHLL